MDLFDVQDALVGVVYCVFNLNCKVRDDLKSVGLKKHQSMTTSHVCFVMKMAKISRSLNSGKPKVADEKSTFDNKV
jgi:hypothetical protein